MTVIGAVYMKWSRESIAFLKSNIKKAAHTKFPSSKLAVIVSIATSRIFSVDLPC